MVSDLNNLLQQLLTLSLPLGPINETELLVSTSEYGTYNYTCTCMYTNSLLRVQKHLKIYTHMKSSIQSCSANSSREYLLPPLSNLLSLSLLFSLYPFLLPLSSHPPPS